MGNPVFSTCSSWTNTNLMVSINMLPKHKPKAVWLRIIMVFGLVFMFIGPRMNIKTAVSTYKAITDKCFHL